MKKLIIILCSTFLIFFFAGEIIIGNLYAQVIVIEMTNCEKTGRRRQVPDQRTPDGGRGGAKYLPPGYHYEYEVKVEWTIAHTPEILTSNLWRDDQPGSCPGGYIVAYNVIHYAHDYYWSNFYQNNLYDLYYRKKNWVPEGTWYYMCEQDGHKPWNEVSVTVP